MLVKPKKIIDQLTSKIPGFGLLLFFLMPFMACEKESPDLTRAERTRVDTLVARQTKVIRVELDSLCDLNFDASVKRAADSILHLRLKEIETLFKRN